MLINKLGEFGLIERIKKGIKTDASVIKGIGDDCAVIALDKYQHLLWTTDMLVEDVDFTWRDNPALVGRKALAVSISDIAACGGIPRYAVVTIGLPKKKQVALVDKLYKGIKTLARQYKINIVGGDISKADKLTIEVSVLGIVKKQRLLLRENAQEGDIIFVSGALGGSIRGKHLRFTPRLKDAQYLVKNFKLHSMIDISDGLLQDLSHILTSSKVGAEIHEAMITVDKKAKGIEEALTMGEDFELLFTMPLSEARKLVRKSRDFSPIGLVVKQSQGFKFIDKKNRLGKISARGFRHF